MPYPLPPQARQIAPGAYIDEGDPALPLLVSVPELLEAAGYAVTPENIALVVQVAREHLRVLYPTTRVTVLD